MSCSSFRVSEQTEFPVLGADNPGNELVNESPRSVLKVTVWMAIGWDGIIGSYFFKNVHNRRVTVDQINYRRMLEEFCLP